MSPIKTEGQLNCRLLHPVIIDLMIARGISVIGNRHALHARAGTLLTCVPLLEMGHNRLWNPGCEIIIPRRQPIRMMDAQARLIQYPT